MADVKQKYGISIFINKNCIKPIYFSKPYFSTLFALFKTSVLEMKYSKDSSQVSPGFCLTKIIELTVSI